MTEYSKNQINTKEDKFKMTKEAKDMIDDMAMIFWGLIFLLGISAAMLLIHIGLAYFFHT